MEEPPPNHLRDCALTWMDKMKLMEGGIYVLFFFIYLSKFESSESLRLFVYF